MTPEEQQHEAKLLRRMQMMLNMVMQTNSPGRLPHHRRSLPDGRTLLSDAKQAALAMFPGKELAYELIWRPRFQRLMRDRFRLM